MKSVMAIAATFLLIIVSVILLPPMMICFVVGFIYCQLAESFKRGIEVGENFPENIKPEDWL